MAPVLGALLARLGERLFDTVTSVRTSDEDLERARRSLVMLSPGQPSGWSREEVVRLIEDLQRCRYRGREVLAALQEMGSIAGRFVSHPTMGRSDVGRPKREPRAGD